MIYKCRGIFQYDAQLFSICFDSVFGSFFITYFKKITAQVISQVSSFFLENANFIKGLPEGKCGWL